NSDGSEKFTLDYRTLRRTLFDDRHFNFLRGDLERLIYDEIKDHVEVRFGSTVASFEQD
ncbi:MAG: monooxygenase, partial [Chloroflexi bacterium]|nr:monooxygenase [Chloroflexota bacterium]